MDKKEGEKEEGTERGEGAGDGRQGGCLCKCKFRIRG